MSAAIETKLYVTNFPSSATRQQLQQFFSRFGRVQECASKCKKISSWRILSLSLFQLCGIRMHLCIMGRWMKVGDDMQIERITGWLLFKARRALDQSNGAMFLNRKLIVQLSTSRFRPQPKEANHFGSKPLITGEIPSSSIAYHHLTHGGGGGAPMTLQQQQSNPLTQQYPNGKYLFECSFENDFE